ncbi:MAG: hypothetical protein JWP01_52 [Myxococcales bacterium]|nr:hypothetical protein [Myxococcales bacterium]
MCSVVSRSCALVACVAALGCGEPAARVTLAPIDHACGRPSGATGIRVTAFASSRDVTRAVGLEERVDLADFPADTEQLGVEVVTGGGAIGAIGKTAVLAFSDLPDAATIPVFMAPPNGFCPTVGTLTEPRTAPLLARAGEGVLVVGGYDAAGVWLSTAEYYDPATATFTAIDVPEVLGENGFAGTALAPLPDGRVAISGGPRQVITLYGPADFGESVLIESRAFHTSIATDDDHVLIAGGCAEVAAGVCAGSGIRKSTKIYDTRELGSYTDGPRLEAGRTGATVFDTGIDDTGQRAYVIAGGTPNPVLLTAADRFTLETERSVVIMDTHAQAARLEGGAVLTAFAEDPAVPSGLASVIAPGVDIARPISRAPDLAGVRLLGLEDGRVVGIGGSPAPGLLVYDPTSDRWQTVMPTGRAEDAPPALFAPSLIALADGSVLVIDGANASQQAWIYRPSLVGPQSGTITVVPGGTTATTTVLSAPDPATVSRTDGWQLTALSEIARALVGGPRMTTGSVTATTLVREGGVGLVARHLGPGQELVAEVVPGVAARLVQRSGGTTRTLCSGKVVPPIDPAVAVTTRLELAGSSARLVFGGTELLACSVEGGQRGAWGVAALGTGARVVVETVFLAR